MSFSLILNDVTLSMHPHLKNDVISISWVEGLNDIVYITIITIVIIITIWIYYLGETNILLCQHSQRQLGIWKKYDAFPSVYWDFLLIAAFGQSCGKLWGKKVDLPKIGCDVLTWIILVFEELWESFCPCSGKSSSGPKCLALRFSTLGTEWSVELAQSGPAAFELRATLHLLTLSLMGGLVVLALCSWMIYIKTLSFGQSVYLLSNYRV